MAVKDWSTTASTNSTADAANGINFAEGQPPGSLNDSMRSLMAVIKGDFANSAVGKGYQKLPNGLILQWTIGTGGTGQLPVFWPIPFPNACLHVQATVVSPQTTALVGTTIHLYDTVGVTLQRLFIANGSSAVTSHGEAVLVFGVGF